MTAPHPPSSDWITSVPVCVVAGKGGVGSSTVAAAIALAAARDGADVLFVSVDGRPGVGPLLGGPEIDNKDRVLHDVRGAGRVRGRTIPADQAFGDYLELKGVGGLLRRAAAAASLPMIAAATPGLEHLLVLGKIKEMQRDGDADLFVVDAPPAGHASPFLRSASGLSDVVTSGPIREQATEVDEMLRDPARCHAVAVTLPEESPVTEAIGLAAELQGLGIHLAPVVANACLPDRAGLLKTPAMAARSHKVKLTEGAKEALASAAEFGRIRLERQREQLERLSAAIGIPVLELPRLATSSLDTGDLADLADALIDPPVVSPEDASR